MKKILIILIILTIFTSAYSKITNYTITSNGTGSVKIEKFGMCMLKNNHYYCVLPHSSIEEVVEVEKPFPEFWKGFWCGFIILLFILLPTIIMSSGERTW